MHMCTHMSVEEGAEGEGASVVSSLRAECGAHCGV